MKINIIFSTFLVFVILLQNAGIKSVLNTKVSKFAKMDEYRKICRPEDGFFRCPITRQCKLRDELGSEEKNECDNTTRTHFNCTMAIIK